MPKRTSDYQTWLLNQLTDPIVAANYLKAAIKDSRKMFLIALRKVADARQMTRVARRSRLSRENLYRMLSETGNPTLTSLEAILKTIGVGFSFEALSPPSPSRPSSKTQRGAETALRYGRSFDNFSASGATLGDYAAQMGAEPPPHNQVFEQSEYQKLNEWSMVYGETQRPQIQPGT